MVKKSKAAAVNGAVNAVNPDAASTVPMRRLGRPPKRKPNAGKAAVPVFDGGIISGSPVTENVAVGPVNGGRAAGGRLRVRGRPPKRGSGRLRKSGGAPLSGGGEGRGRGRPRKTEAAKGSPVGGGMPEVVTGGAPPVDGGGPEKINGGPAAGGQVSGHGRLRKRGSGCPLQGCGAPLSGGDGGRSVGRLRKTAAAIPFAKWQPKPINVVEGLATVAPKGGAMPAVVTGGAPPVDGDGPEKINEGPAAGGHVRGHGRLPKRGSSRPLKSAGAPLSGVGGGRETRSSRKTVAAIPAAKGPPKPINVVEGLVAGAPEGGGMPEVLTGGAHLVDGGGPEKISSSVGNRTPYSQLLVAYLDLKGQLDELQTKVMEAVALIRPSLRELELAAENAKAPWDVHTLS